MPERKSCGHDRGRRLFRFIGLGPSGHPRWADRCRVRGALTRIPHRGFLPWRLSDDGPGARGIVREGAVIRNPSQQRTHALQQAAPLFDHQTCDVARSHDILRLGCPSYGQEIGVTSVTSCQRDVPKSVLYNGSGVPFAGAYCINQICSVLGRLCASPFLPAHAALGATGAGRR
jgi:hypothetical protein